jgi:hypothetical protein
MNQQTLDQICNRIAKNFYAKNRLLCATASFGVDDLKQEAKIYAWKMWQKNMGLDKEHLSKLVSKAATWRMKSLRAFAMLVKAKLELKGFNEKEINWNGIKRVQSYWDGFSKEPRGGQKYFYLRRKMPYTLEMLMDDLSNVCNKKQCYILYEKIVNDKTFAKIGKDLDICRNGVKWHYDEAMKRINERFFKNFSFETKNK